jgi:hypothetical protein
MSGFRSSPEPGITRGKLRIPGSRVSEIWYRELTGLSNVVATFFEKSLGSIKDGLRFAHKGTCKLAKVRSRPHVLSLPC